MVHRILSVLILTFTTTALCAQSNSSKNFAVIAYYTGNEKEIDEYPVDKLTHIIFSFCYLKDNKLVTGSPDAAARIKKLVSLKKKYPALKILLSLGGWGGCKDCSESFSTAAGRNTFAVSVNEMLKKYNADGIDLDWEYPAIEGYPGHPYKPEDKGNFTELVLALRKELGEKMEISFAAGGFTKFLQESVEWDKVMPLLNRVNLMTYDLINGYSPITGHHTGLYSTDIQIESTDHAVRYLDSIGVPKNKMVIGTAFYARVFEGADSLHNGVNRPARFKSFVPYKQLLKEYTIKDGFVPHWDEQAQAPYSYNSAKKLFATYDDLRSIRLKTKYAISQGLNGIMFWELTLDVPKGGLLDEIDKTKKEMITER
ncbi:glycoside hydrolase family 18 protein [Pseudoflavitalea rhizosphaerae]|uniref:glycoside hydrolase family 18 protein n=1 Tax=Pseudoflavitalea rhizosphaerae TaxID=1884793 RepID=UPI000F8E3095|nr:glycoside hydrolase family 18 protein [Pseudoflavitalea rhizosphaerae]